MKSKATGIFVILAFVALMVSAYVLYNVLSEDAVPDQLAVQTQPTVTVFQETSATEASETQQVQIMAPDFTVYDLEGNEVHLSDFVGKPVVVNFWASWCGPCKMEMPDFQEKYQELGEEIHFLMVNMTDGSRETVETAASFIETQGYTFPVFFDTASSAAITYGVYSLPTTYFIDAQGHAIAQATGAIDGETLQRGIDMIK